MFVHNWVVVQVHGNGFIPIPSDVILRGVFPPVIKRRVKISIKKLVVKPQTETGSRQSIGPNLGVLAMAAHLLAVPLLSKVTHDP